MNFRKWFIIGICALSLCGAVRAQGNCHSGLLTGTYGVSMGGWATVPPGPAFLPFAALGVVIVDSTGSGSGPVNQVLAGQSVPLDTITFRLKIFADCTLTFVADCANGCHWEGTGTFYRANKQIDLLFMKVGTGQFPVTTIATMKQL